MTPDDITTRRPLTERLQTLSEHLDRANTRRDPQIAAGDPQRAADGKPVGEGDGSAGE